MFVVPTVPCIFFSSSLLFLLKKKKRQWLGEICCEVYDTITLWWPQNSPIKLLLQKQELNYKSNPHGRSIVLGSSHHSLINGRKKKRQSEQTEINNTS